MAQAQNFSNHTRTVPMFHMVALPILMGNFGWSVYRLTQLRSIDSVVAVFVAAALLLVALYGRLFALTVQDRVIRLEMRLRLQQLLPQDLRARIPEFTVGQLVSLRFASDAELPALARKVLDEKVTDRKAIKRLIRDWQPDLLRA
ncbi:MAG TPA: DUF6526 family protein [Verrucomicrobiae bacterium]|nr:DUF6526 family protein [Verrucomicrobiae bacterium]